MVNKRTIAVLFLGVLLLQGRATRAESAVPEDAKKAFAVGDYAKAIDILNHVASTYPRDATVKHLLARCYFEDEQFDRAISAAETTVALDAGNSEYHLLLGRAYGEKADRSGPFSAMALAKKARREFETAVKLDEHNFDASQALIEFYCGAPGIVGGGEDKARPEIKRLGELDAIEGHYATGNCRRQRKDDQTADVEFRQALALHPSSVDLVGDIADHYMKHRQPEQLSLAIKEGERVAPNDLRWGFYRAVLSILRSQDLLNSSQLLRDYMAKAPKRANYPSKAMVHYWLGQIHENQNSASSAKREYQQALQIEPKNRFAKEALNRLQRD